LGHDVEIFIIEGFDFMASPSAEGRLNDFFNSLDECIDSASRFAIHSEYSDDVERAGGISVCGVVVRNQEDMRIWFTLGETGLRLSVTMISKTPVDVYCET
jgi:hypothetical protein